MKIALVGGGSYSWTIILVQNFLGNPFFKGITFCLMDINEKALDEVYQVCLLYLKEYPDSGIHFKKTMLLADALQGASYVIVAISHGGLEAELEDHRIARRYGFYNVKGSEVGIAGCSRTLRQVPELVRIARMMEKFCPQATMLNVTNPLTAITRAVNKYTTIRALGFCHGVMNHLQLLFPFFGADGWEGIDFNVAGIDHCSWLLDVRYRGNDMLKKIRDDGFVDKARQGQNLVQYDDPFAGRENQRLRFLIWDIVGYLPALSDEHCVEFFGQIMKDADTRSYFKMEYDRIKERTATVRGAGEKIHKILAGQEPLVKGRSGEILDRFIEAVNGGGSYTDVLNYPNEGQVGNLPLDSVVETKCTVDATGVHPIHAGNLPPIIESIVRPVCIREELYMEAAMEDDIGKLKGALATDPLVNDFRRIDALCAELMNYNRQFLRGSE